MTLFGIWQVVEDVMSRVRNPWMGEGGEEPGVTMVAIFGSAG